MKLVLQFDCDADIIDVPQCVIDNREILRKKFLKWMYNKNNKHRYWVVCKDFVGVCYRGDAFVEWLNKKVLNKSAYIATIIEQKTYQYSNDLPVIFF